MLIASSVSMCCLVCVCVCVCVWYNEVGPSAHVSSIVHIEDDKAEENDGDDGDDGHCVALVCCCLVCVLYQTRRRLSTLATPLRVVVVVEPARAIPDVVLVPVGPVVVFVAGASLALALAPRWAAFAGVRVVIRRDQCGFGVVQVVACFVKNHVLPFQGSCCCVCVFYQIRYWLSTHS